MRFLSFKTIAVLSFFSVVNLLLQPLYAQICPANIDLERGDFTNWKTYIGGVYSRSGANEIVLSETTPIPGRHQIFSRTDNLLNTDPFGNFPVVCPNGSGYSVKLGNTSGGAEAEGLSYEFTIPAGRNEYSLTYYYAIVFEGPNHQDHQQPRLEIEVTNLSDNEKIDCSSFTFISYGSGLPGFQISPNQPNNNAIVLYKEWTPVTINLNGKAGKTIRLFFKTADCTFVRHFGYAYVDVNTECNGEFPGAAFCPNDAFVKVTAPYGFQEYKWFNSTFSTILSTSNELVLAPAPSSGSIVAVEVTPFPGFGCKDTLFTKLMDTLTVRANAGSDATYCGKLPVLIGEAPQTGRIYSWLPTAGLSNPYSSNPLASPGVTTTYVLTVSSNGGGCRDVDSVRITADLPDTSLLFLGKTAFCSTSNDSAVFITNLNASIQWYKDGIPISGASNKRFITRESGTYYALVKNRSGCELKTRETTITIDDPEIAVRYPIRYTFQDRAIQLKARDIGDDYKWTPPNFLSNEAGNAPFFSTTRLGVYNYLIRITEPSGCYAIDTQAVKVITRVEVFVPTAFTPNYDGLNDFLTPLTSGIEQVQFFRIYDRYGNQLFEWKPGSKGWDGTYKNQPQVPGTFIWQYSGLGIDGEIYFRRGTVVLIR